MDDNRLLGLILVFAPLSILSFGGGQAIIADMQHQTVDVWGWLSVLRSVCDFARGTRAQHIDRGFDWLSDCRHLGIDYRHSGDLYSLVHCRLLRHILVAEPSRLPPQALV